MTAADLEEVVALEESCGLSLWGREGYAAELMRQEAVMLVIKESPVGERITSAGEEITPLRGFIAARLNADELHINNIAVNPAWRNRGLGHTLLDEAMRQGKRLGAKWAVLEVRAGNEAAQRLYSAHGFSVLGRRPSYYAAPIEDALIMGATV